MKRKILVLLTIFAVALSAVCPVAARADEKKPVNLYVFYAGYCGFCSALHNYLDTTLTKDEEYGKMFNVVYIEIADEKGYGNETNQEMFRTVAERFQYTKLSIPFYVVGDEYNVGFDDAETPKVLKDMIKKAYDNDKYEDIVSTLIDISKVESLSASASKSSKDNNTVGYIVLGVTAIAIVAIIFGRSKTHNEE